MDFKKIKESFNNQSHFTKGAVVGTGFTIALIAATPVTFGLGLLAAGALTGGVINKQRKKYKF